jgi:hypothetical protein
MDPETVDDRVVADFVHKVEEIITKIVMAIGHAGNKN